jgi:hypothetical protein
VGLAHVAAGAALPQGFESQALVKLLGCGAAVGSAASLGLKQLADAGQLGSPTAQRLQLGLIGFATGAPLCCVAMAYCFPCVVEVLQHWLLPVNQQQNPAAGLQAPSPCTHSTPPASPPPR